MNKELITQYISNFKRAMSFFLKRDVAIKAIVYPYANGGIIVFEFLLNDSGNTEFKSESKTMQEAVEKTKLFDKPYSATDEMFTKTIISGNKVIIVKSSNKDVWNNSAAEKDVKGIAYYMSKNG